jgi:hypothetical protein
MDNFVSNAHTPNEFLPTEDMANDTHCHPIQKGGGHMGQGEGQSFEKLHAILAVFCGKEGTLL